MLVSRAIGRTIEKQLVDLVSDGQYSKEATEGEDKEAVQTEADTKEKFNTDENGAVSLS